MKADNACRIPDMDSPARVLARHVGRKHPRETVTRVLFVLYALFDAFDNLWAERGLEGLNTQREGKPGPSATR
jgi:hypothetical protein